MNLERYSYFSSEDYHDYEFCSEGPNGRIIKKVSFTHIPETKPSIYNLAFGDLNRDTGELDDSVISNNDDRDVILATVANTVVEFCEHFGNPFIYAKGSTPSRTRLYQRGIARLWKEIRRDFEVYGLKDSVWYDFEPYNANYEAFLVKRR